MSKPTTYASPAAPRPRTHSWWVCRARQADTDRVLVVDSHHYPDGALIELPYAEALELAGPGLVSEAVVERGRVTALHVARRFAPQAPALWFTEIAQPSPTPPATNLVAFLGAGQAVGALLGPAALAATGVRSEDQIGAIRWYPGTGEVDQVYVAPAWRRHHIATSLLGAAGALIAARGWPRFWGDGQRTALGEQLRNSRSWRERTADLTHLAAPMTPPG